MNTHSLLVVWVSGQSSRDGVPNCFGTSCRALSLILIVNQQSDCHGRPPAFLGSPRRIDCDRHDADLCAQLISAPRPRCRTVAAGRADTSPPLLPIDLPQNQARAPSSCCAFATRGHVLALAVQTLFPEAKVPRFGRGLGLKTGFSTLTYDFDRPPPSPLRRLISRRSKGDGQKSLPVTAAGAENAS